jgi:DNA-binding HxlR family transcriptional regulator
MVAEERQFQHFPVQHFCPVARTLEVLGERWSFLIVRDLLRGPQRFSDLQRYLAGITPKRLTVRLRALEAAGIVAREEVPGRREVRYALTPKGLDLRPALESLAAWGLDHAMVSPVPEKTYYPEQLMSAFGVLLRRRVAAPPAPVCWVVEFADGQAYTIRHDGARWTVRSGDAPEATLRVATTPIAWAGLLAARPAERWLALGGMALTGDEEQAGVLRTLLGGAG